jgi:MFS family permease
MYIVMNKKLNILLLGSNIWIFADSMLGPLFAVFTKRIGGDILDISWAWATYFVFTGVLTIIIGRVSDRYKKEGFLVFGYGLTAICTFGYLLVSSPMHLFFIQAGLGVALAFCNPTWYALYGKYTPKESSGYTWGIADGLGKILSGIAIFVGGAVVVMFSFDALFIIMGSLFIIATFVQFFMILKS